MGEVYRARDTRLDRIVAVKVLSSHLADVPAARERFDREARAISGLNHPHICTVYDVGHQSGIDYLVMEYLEGVTLGQQLQKAPMPIELTLRYAVEIADALDSAHRLGVVHRDLKPANVILTQSGTKLLDFGLAKLQSSFDSSENENVTKPSSAALRLTEEGTVLGTLPYMAPEQLEGKDADARTDIFAFGAMVYEMATGRKAFEGTSRASLIGAILHLHPPAMTSFDPPSPLPFDRVIRKCLAKHPDDRWQTARDLADELRWISTGEAAPKETPARPHRLKKVRAALWPALTGVLALSALLLAIAYYMRDVPANPAEIRFQIGPPENNIFSPAPADLSISPDGRSVVFAALNAKGNQVLWIRPLDSAAARPLTGTEEAFSPFWSPDSRQVAFFAQGKLKRIDAGGGAPQIICDVPDGRGGTWNRDGVIVFARNLGGQLYRVAAVGGSAAPLTSLDQTRQESAHLWPEFLPDSDHYLYLAWSEQKEKRQVRVGSLSGGQPVNILNAESNVAFAPPNHLLFSGGGKLLAQNFDPRSLTVSGDPFPVSEDVWANPATGRASFDVAANGVIVYRNGVNFSTFQFVQYDRAGNVISRSGAPGGYSNPSLSPDGKRIAVDFRDYQKNLRNIWTLELDRGISSRLTFGMFDFSPVWVDRGRQLIFISDRKPFSVYRTEFGGNGREEMYFTAEGIRELLDWSESEKAVVLQTFTPATKADISILRLADSTPSPYLQSAFDEIHGQISPDGRWLAYSSDENGRYEVYVQKFPLAGSKRQISTDGGMQPRWNPNGKELFYIAPDRILMAATTSTGAAFEVGAPKALFQTGVYGPSIVRSRNNYVVSAGGDSFIVNSIVDSRQPINVVVGWKPQ